LLILPSKVIKQLFNNFVSLKPENMIEEKLKRLKSEIPATVKLVAVSKTKPAEEIMRLYQKGQRFFGENKVQELVAKYEELPKDIEWHMIGHLQTNKVKFIAPFISYIQSVDSIKLLEAINKEALKINRTINCLLQVYIANEKTKFGLDEEELITLLQSDLYKSLQNVKICGLMGIATYTENKDQIRKEFTGLSQLFFRMKKRFFDNAENFKELSMGMSGDYAIAIEEGSTLVRIGSLIFGERHY
jgi:PLP dependent protein